MLDIGFTAASLKYFYFLFKCSFLLTFIEHVRKFKSFSSMLENFLDLLENIIN